MRYSLLPLALTLALSALGQTAPASPSTRTAADTLRAVQQLFQQRRTGSALLVGGSVAFVAGLTAASSTEKEGLIDTKTVAALAAIPALPVLTVGVLKGSRFSPRRQQQVLAEYQRTHRLPPAVLQRLRARHFE